MITNLPKGIASMRLLILTIFLIRTLFGGCSTYVDKIYINEVFVAINGSSSLTNWIELNQVDKEVNTTKWRLQITSPSKQDQTLPLDSKNFSQKSNYLVSSTSLAIYRNSGEVSNLTLFDELNQTVDSVTIYGPNANKDFMPSSQDCELFNSSNSSVKSFVDGSVKSYFNDIERLNDGKLWLSWKNLGSLGEINLPKNSSTSQSKGYSIEIFNNQNGGLNTLLSSQQFEVNIKSSADLVNTNRIVVVGSTDNCKSENINLQCNQVTLANNVLAATISCTAPVMAYKQLWLKLFDGRNEFCSADSFSIRPAKFLLNRKNPVVVGLDDVEVVAVDIFDNKIGNYNSTVEINATVENIVCPARNLLHNTAEVEIKNGSGSVKLADVGLANVEVSDRHYADIDKNGGCIESSDYNSLSQIGIHGCNIYGNKDVNSTAHSFAIFDQNISNYNGGNFTYRYASSLDSMSAKVAFGISANSKNGDILKNYHSGCYEYKIKISPVFLLPDKNDVVVKNIFDDFYYCGFQNGVCILDFDSLNGLRFNLVKPKLPTVPIVVAPESVQIDVQDANGVKSVSSSYGGGTASFVFGSVGLRFANESLKLVAEIFDTNESSLFAKDKQAGSKSGFWINDMDNFSYFGVAAFDDSQSSRVSSAISFVDNSGYFQDGIATVSVLNIGKKHLKAMLLIDTPAYLLDDHLESSYLFCDKKLCMPIEMFAEKDITTWHGYGTNRGFKSMEKFPNGHRK